MFDFMFLALGLLSSFIAAYSSLFFIPTPILKNKFRAVYYVFWLLNEILISSVSLIPKIYSFKIDLNSGFAKMKIDCQDDLIVTMIGNSITLTPGTVTVNTDENSLTIHALSEDLHPGCLEIRDLVIKKHLQ